MGRGGIVELRRNRQFHRTPPCCTDDADVWGRVTRESSRHNDRTVDEQVGQTNREHFGHVHCAPIDAKVAQRRVTDAFEKIIHDFRAVVVGAEVSNGATAEFRQVIEQITIDG